MKFIKHLSLGLILFSFFSILYLEVFANAQGAIEKASSGQSLSDEECALAYATGVIKDVSKCSKGSRPAPRKALGHADPMCNSRTDKSKSCMACITKCGKGPTTENEPYQDKDGKWKSRKIICIDGSESLECSDRFSHCRENCGGGPAMCGDC